MGTGSFQGMMTVISQFGKEEKQISTLSNIERGKLTEMGKRFPVAFHSHSCGGSLEGCVPGNGGHRSLLTRPYVSARLRF